MSVIYNVYRVYFEQREGSIPDHVGIALVPSEFPLQDKGRYYHVKGDVGVGMDYECRKGYNFQASRGYKKQEYVFRFSKDKLSEFEAIAAAAPVPYDPRLLYSSRASLNPPAPDCTTWVDEVLETAQGVL
ncbi:hypothetical protein ABW20_dc0102338 [Dactylellina cionopaga]|nr:hypothetical protein ABW20_dc0102338 [Dactylellina cionopaga]